MDELSRLTKEMKELEKQKEDTERAIKEIKKKRQQNHQEVVRAYKEFYDQQTKEFVLYQQTTPAEVLLLYLDNYDNFPLYEKGKLKVAELAEIIKHSFQFTTDKEYDILTTGVTSRIAVSSYYPSQPHVFFIIGNDKTLAPFKEFNGKYINEPEVYRDIYMNASEKDLIKIELDFLHFYSLPLECLIPNSLCNEKGRIYYYDYDRKQYLNFAVDNSINIFNRRLEIKFKLIDSPNKNNGIKDVFSFAIDAKDTFLADILISIIMYKRNNNIKELTDEDYNYIFGCLFGENIDMSASIQRDIPQSLIYVPNKEWEKNFY